MADRWAEIDAAYYQINLLRERPHRMANMVYAWAIERVDPDKFDEWLADLAELLEWQTSDSEAAANLESQSFFDMQSKGG